MIRLDNVHLHTTHRKSSQKLLDDISLIAKPGEFVAIIGASGSGKSTLLKLIAGIFEPDEGHIYWNERDLVHEQDMAPAEVGYIPQFSIAYDHLTVWENVDSAMRLRVAGISANERVEKIQHILEEVGLGHAAERLVKVLSGGEQRRLALAIELVGNPVLVLSDEVTSGLDPVSEQEITTLLHSLSRHEARVVLSVTHSLDHIELYDKIIILHEGKLVYNGPPSELCEYFGVAHPEEVYLEIKMGKAISMRPPNTIDELEPTQNNNSAKTPKPSANGAPIDRALPGYFTHFLVLITRRWKMFFRDKGQLWLQLGLILGFPAVIVIFALDGLPSIRNLNMEIDIGVLQQLREVNQYIIESTSAGAIISSLAMFQVILLTLMASNNGAREITSERLIFEKEKLAGLHITSYLFSKIAFLFVLLAIQSCWMTFFVKTICDFPGTLLPQMLLLFLVNAAVTCLCLSVSSMMKTSEQASLISIYFVGFQLPLSGAVLALPDALAWLTRPFISAYWSWSGYIMTMRETRLYDVVKLVSQTEISPVFLCYWVLCSHIILGIIITFMGCKHSRWKNL